MQNNHKNKKFLLYLILIKRKNNFLNKNKVSQAWNFKFKNFSKNNFIFFLIIVILIIYFCILKNV